MKRYLFNFKTMFLGTLVHLSSCLNDDLPDVGDLVDLTGPTPSFNFNEITTSQIWPATWKTEFVTAIPKKSSPEGIQDLRNISCTALVSKLYESYVLEWLKGEIRLKTKQEH